MPFVARDGGSVVNGWSKWNTTGGGQEFLSLPDAEITTFNAIGDTLPVARVTQTVAATQAEQETGTEADKFVAPATQHHHITAAKVLAHIDSQAPSLGFSYNIDFLTDLGTGRFQIDFDTNFSDENYVPQISVGDFSGGTSDLRGTFGDQPGTTVRSVSAINFNTHTVAGVLIDPSEIYITIHGDQ